MSLLPWQQGYFGNKAIHIFPRDMFTKYQVNTTAFSNRHSVYYFLSKRGRLRSVRLLLLWLIHEDRIEIVICAVCYANECTEPLW